MAGDSAALMTPAGRALRDRLLHHAHAPHWNAEVGDRLEPGDLELIEAMRADRRPAQRGNTPPPAWLLDRVASLRERVESYRERLGRGADLARTWTAIATTSREDIATSLATMVPRDADMRRLIAYTSSGTTGHAIEVPEHPVSVAARHVTLERLLARWGLPYDWGPQQLACANLCAQEQTHIFAMVCAVWRDAGLVKVNLRDADWPRGRLSARRYLAAWAPRVITADPITLDVAMRWDLELEPSAITSTAMALSPELAQAASARFGCPVIDWYSTTETGPIAASSPDGRGLELLCNDLYVEIIDQHGQLCAPGQVGDVAVSGGRNPYLPLLRYRTGDRAAFDERGRLIGLQGREAVMFWARDGRQVNSVDLARVLRQSGALVQHQLHQHADGRCSVWLRPALGQVLDREALLAGLRELLGDWPITIAVDAELGHARKPVWRSEMSAPPQ